MAFDPTMIQDYLSKNPKLQDIYTEVEGMYSSKSHDLNHVKRVMENCIKIGEKEGADLEVVLLTALLHDLCRAEENIEGKHAELSAEHARRILEKNQQQEVIDKVVRCIECHDFISEKEPETIEEKVFFDADKLDAYGAVGVARFFTLAGEKGWDLDKAMGEALRKIRGVGKTGGFYTQTAREIGHRKALRIFAFYYHLARELGREDYEEELTKLFRDNMGKLKGKTLLKIINSLC